MTIAITRNLPGRFDGFLKSCMHNIAPGVYIVPKMNKSVRDRLWAILLEWAEAIPEDGGVVLFWSSKKAPSGLAFRLLGWPKKEIREHEGFWLTFSELTKTDDLDHLKELAKKVDIKKLNDYSNDPTILNF